MFQITSKSFVQINTLQFSKVFHRNMMANLDTYVLFMYMLIGMLCIVIILSDMYCKC